MKIKMKFFSNYITVSIFFVLIVTCSTINAQTQFQKTEKEFNVKEYLTEDRLNIEVKEFFIRQIRKTELVKPIDNHEFVHFFLNRYETNCKDLIKDRFKTTKSISKDELIAIINNELIPLLADAFNKRKNKHVKEINKKKSHYEWFNLGNQENFKGPGDPCTNADFETGDATGWDLSKGGVDGLSVYSYVNVTPTTLGPSTQHTIMTGAGTDAIGGFPVVYPGGTYSLMLGDGIGTNNSAADASQTFLVDPSSAAFSYSYAIVLQDAGHTPQEQPYFKINMYDQAGNSIQCGDYAVVAGGSPVDPDFVPYGVGPEGYYMPWRTTFAPLTAYIGQNVTIEFIVGDCSQGAHYGYAYLDASCSAMEVLGPDTITCTGPPTIFAPPGAASYLWSPTGETTQSIVTTTPGLYQVTVTPVTGALCAITLDKQIYEFIDTVTAVFSAVPDSICAGESITFTDQSFVTGSGIISTWEWDFDGNGTVDNNSQNPSYVYNTAGTYNVNLNVITPGCSDDTTMQVVVVSGSTANFTAPTVCLGLVTNFTDASLGGVDTWGWDFNNDGIVDNTSQNPSFTFLAAGTYPVNLAVSVGGSCPGDTTINILVSQSSIANFTAPTVCLGLATNFTDASVGGVDTWNWDFNNDGIIDNTSQNPSYTFPSAGTFPVYLQVSIGGFCSHDTTINVTVNQSSVASFSTPAVCLGIATPFTDLSVGGVNLWDWDFNNDGIVDNSTQNPSYTFPSVGTYPVNLNVSVGGLCPHDTTINVIVSAQPTAAFTFTNECFGTTTGFTDLSNPNGGTISNWDWDFTNNGTVDNTSQNPTNGYPAAGSYTVELMVSTALGCVDSITMQAVVNPIPVADFSVADVCFGATSTFNDSSNVITGNIIDWQWNFGDGVGTSVLQNPTYTYTNAGTYPVTLTITSDSGCINTVIDSASAFALPTAAFTTNNVCLNLAASFTDNSNGNGGIINNWQWDLDGNGTTDNTNQNPTNLYPSANTYSVQLIVSTSFGCADTIVQPITIYPMPIAAFTFVNACFGTAISFTDNSSVTSGTITNWNWNFGNSNTSIVQNPSENYSSEGVYNVQLIATTNNGCADTIVQQIEVWPIPVVNFSPTEVCLNAASQFTDLSTVSSTNTTNNIIQWQWNFGDGVGTSAIQNPIYTYTQDGVYPTSLTVTSNNGCFNSVTLNVTVNPLPQVIFGDPTAGCAPNMCVTFTNSTTINTGSIASWQWDFGDGFSSPSMTPSHCYENTSYSVLQSFDVTLTAISNKQCTTSVMMPQLITVYPKPLADFDYTPINADIYDNEITFIDKSIIASSWDWDLGDGSFSTQSNPVHIYQDSGFYYVILYIENSYGCKDTTSKAVRIKPDYAVWIPNVFTPNGDGSNDYFFTQGYGLKEIQTFIFDRWGMLLFDGYFLDSKWDGTYKGKICQEDVYVYRIKVKDVFNEWHEYIGRITLIK